MLTAHNVNEAPDRNADGKQATTPARPTADEVIDLVRRDSQEKPKEYLDEVHVPGGGE